MIEFNTPLDLTEGLGYSPASGPPSGGWGFIDYNTSFMDQKIGDLLPGDPKVFSFGNTVYPLNDQSSRSISNSFPKHPIGKGDTPGGDGGILLQGLPSAQQYWGFGRRRSSKRSTTQKGSRSTKVSRSKRRSSKRSKVSRSTGSKRRSNKRSTTPKGSRSKRRGNKRSKVSKSTKVSRSKRRSNKY